MARIARQAVAKRFENDPAKRRCVSQLAAFRDAGLTSTTDPVDVATSNAADVVFPHRDSRVMMKPNDWPYYNSDDKSVYLLAILFLSWCSENLSNPPTSTAAGLKTFFWVIVLTNVASIVFMHGMQFAEWKDVNKDVWVNYIVTSAIAYYAAM